MCQLRCAAIGSLNGPHGSDSQNSKDDGTTEGVIRFIQTSVHRPIHHVFKSVEKCTEAAMSLQDERQKTSGSYMPLVCWRCDAPMKIKTIEPAMAGRYDEIVYKCPTCDIERKRTAVRVDHDGPALGVVLFPSGLS